MRSLTDEGAKEDSANTTQHKVFKTSAKCPTTTIKLHGNDFTCLLDTGSEVSTISESFYHKHLSNLEINTQKTLRLVAANNIQIPYLGYVEVDIELFGCTFSNVGFLVSTSNDAVDTTDGILGCNILNHIHSFMKEEKVNFRNTVEENALQTVTSTLDMAKKDANISFVKVAGRDEVKIPANSMKVVIGSTRQNKKGEEYTAAVQAIYGTSGSLPRNIMVIDTLGKVESGKIPVRI